MAMDLPANPSRGSEGEFLSEYCLLEATSSSFFNKAPLIKMAKHCPLFYLGLEIYRKNEGRQYSPNAA